MVSAAQIQSQMDKCPIIISNFNYLNTYSFMIDFSAALAALLSVAKHGSITNGAPILFFLNSFQHNISCDEPVLVVESLGHVTHAFINNMYIGNAITIYTHINIKTILYRLGLKMITLVKRNTIL